MLDIQLLRNDIDAVADRLATRGYTLDRASFLKLEAERKTLQTRTQDLQASRNSLSKQIGVLKGKGEDASSVLAEVAALKAELEGNEVRLAELLKDFDAFVAQIPNVPQESVPVGRSEADNVEVHRWGTPRVFDFAVKDHVDLGESLGQLDFATAARFPISNTTPSSSSRPKSFPASNPSSALHKPPSVAVAAMTAVVVSVVAVAAPHPAAKVVSVATVVLPVLAAATRAVSTVPNALPMTALPTAAAGLLGTYWPRSHLTASS